MIKYVKGCIPTTKEQDTYSRKGVVYNNEIFTFDTENSSGWRKQNGEVVQFDFSVDSKIYLDLKPVMLTYICMFGIGSNVYYCRYLHEVKDFFTELQEKYTGKLTIWVHNLAYDFQAVLLNLFNYSIKRRIIKENKAFCRVT